MQASPRVDVGRGLHTLQALILLCVTELEDTHDSIKLLKSTIILNSSTQKLCRYPILMKLLDSARRLVWMIRTLIAGIITFQFEDDLSSVQKSKSRTQQYSASGWSWDESEALQGL